MEGFVIFLSCSATFFCVLMGPTAAVDTITTNQTIRDGETIVSASGSFELGFFSPGSSGNWYLGIRYKKVSAETMVWVANRDTPLTNCSGVLRFDSQGNLVLLNSSDSKIWSTNSTNSPTNPVAQLLDNGNLVLRDGSDTNLLWQSFDYPGDTFLPGMKLGRDLVTGLDWHLSCWKSADDPSPGNYTIGLDLYGYPQLIVRKGLNVTYRSGPWNGIGFSGMASLRDNRIYEIELARNEKEISYTYELINWSVVTRLMLTSNGELQRFTWNNRTNVWWRYMTAQVDACEDYARCGAYGSCNISNSPQCECLEGFKPKFQEEWDAGDWTNGCVRTNQVGCGNGDGFRAYSGLKLPDTQQSWFNRSMDLEECRRLCLRNCSCTAYANTDIRGGGSGCLTWFRDLIDIRVLSNNGQDLYVRMAASDLETNSSSGADSSSGARNRGIIIAASVLVVLGMLLLLHLLRRRKLKREAVRLDQEIDYTCENGEKDFELPLFGFEAIANATNNFSIDNKLGEGGFGPVYKGVLEGAKEIAVKRLSKDSRQGLDEFKNEVLCIAKLQHRNLVKLLGSCIEVEERMLIYEYMPNKSVDFFIFDKNTGMLLDWQQRYSIIKGIARGLLYLHQDSRLRIIHRDLKASNVLLDLDMNPKISDFGMARCLGGDEMEAKKTSRIVGTYGYMSPEYAIDGLFSVKSDVFSFGVLVLEIVSGKKNRGFCHTEHDLNLLGHAWRLYKEGNPVELIDASIVNSSCNLSEAFRSILIGLLCVQQSPKDRPSMSSVVVMLGSEIELPQPKHPGFFTERKFPEANSSSNKADSHSVNKLTVTVLAPR